MNNAMRPSTLNVVLVLFKHDKTEGAYFPYVCVWGGRLFSEFFVAFLKTDFQDTRCILEKVSLDGMSNHEQVQPCIFMNS